MMSDDRKFLNAGYSGDVWYPQPAPKDHPWRYMPNHAMTPHISGTTIDAQVISILVWIYPPKPKFFCLSSLFMNHKIRFKLVK